MNASTSLVRLDHLAEINPRLNEKIVKEQLVSFVPMSAVSAETACIVGGEEAHYEEVAKGYTPFQNGDVLVAKITPCFENGKIAQAQIPHRLGFGSTEFHVVRPWHDKLDARFILHFLRQDNIRLDGEKRMTGSAGQRRVPEHFLANLLVPLPPLDEQRRLAAILDKADALRAQRRAALAHLDALTQAVFLDMFGDPATNPKGWEETKIGDLLESATYGTSKKAQTDGFYPMLRMNNILTTGAMDLSDLKYVNLDVDEQIRHLVRKGDILFNRTNSPELVGKTAIYRLEQPVAYAGYLIRLRVKAENSSEYVSGFLNTAYAKRVLKGMCKSIIGMANINATELQSIKIAKPPTSLQIDYSHIIESIVKFRDTQRASLAELDALFASLQHRAFRGEL